MQSPSLRLAGITLGILGMLLPAACAEEYGPPSPGLHDVAASGAEALNLPAPTPSAVTATLAPAYRPRPAVSYRFEPGPGEFRGAWLHWQDYLSPQAVARTVARARNAGLNVLLPLANYPDQAMWQSALIPTNAKVAPGFCPMTELVKQAHAVGLQVHPYLIMLNGGLTKHPAFKPDWYARDRHGNLADGWLNPAHPEVREFLTQLCAELARTGVDGLHLDYIRHEYDTDYDYGELTRQRCLNELGFDPLTLFNQTQSSDGMRFLETSFLTGDGQSHYRSQQAFCRLAGYQPQPVAEDNLSQLRRDTVLVCGGLYSDRVKGETINALIRFIAQGGAALILDGPEAVSQSQRLAQALGIDGRGYFDEGPVDLYVVGQDHPIAAGVPSVIRTRGRGNPCPKAVDAAVIAVFADGTPAVTAKQYGEGTAIVFNFNCYQSAAASNPELLRMFSNAVEWLCRSHGIFNAARISKDVPNAPALFEQWRVQQVTELVKQVGGAVRAIRPDIVRSIAGGTQTEDIRRVKRDAGAWLRNGLIDYVCPMAYTSDNALFRRRLTRELQPVPESRYRQVIYAGIGAYKMERAPQRVVEQVNLARSMGYHGVCFFAFENLTDAMLTKLRQGPFQHPAPVPWRLVPSAGTTTDR